MNGKSTEVGVFFIGAVALLLTVLVGMSNSWKEAAVILIVAAIAFWLCVRYGWIITIGELIIKISHWQLFPTMLVSNFFALGLLIGFGRSFLGSLGLATLVIGMLYALYRIAVTPPVNMADRWTGLASLLFVVGGGLVAYWALTENENYRVVGAIAMAAGLIVYDILEWKRMQKTISLARAILDRSKIKKHQ